MEAKKQGILQALGVALYCSLVGIFMWNGDKIFPKIDSFLGPIVVLLLFSSSVMICGLLVFYKPYKLFFADKKKEAVNVVLYTSISLFVLLILFFLLMIIFK